MSRASFLELSAASLNDYGEPPFNSFHHYFINPRILSGRSLSTQTWSLDLPTGEVVKVPIKISPLAKDTEGQALFEECLEGVREGAILLLSKDLEVDQPEDMVIVQFTASALQPQAETLSALQNASTKGEVKGVLVSKTTNKPLGVTPNLWRDAEEGEDQEEIQRLMNAVENKADSTGAFHFVEVPPGHFFLLTREHGIIGEGFNVRPGKVVDLGKVQVENSP
jgi:hypothetical protein